MSTIQYVGPTGVLYLQPADMAANKTYDTKHPASLLVDIKRSHPWAPAWPAYPEALVRDRRLQGPKLDRSLLLLTAAEFQRIWLRESRQHSVKNYVEQWHREELKHAKAVDHEFIEHELITRRDFFAAAYKILTSREHGIAKARRLEMAIFNYIRAQRLAHHLADEAEVIKLIKAGVARHARFWAWRLDNQYAAAGAHSLVKVKAGGHPLERLIGDLMWRLRGVATKQHHEWRLDNLYGILANGGITKLHHQPGMALEHVFAKAQAPREERRRQATREWHKNIRVIASPNHTPVHANGLGDIPEAILPKLWQPKLDERRRKANEWHIGHLLVKQPNGAFLPASDHLHGLSPERVTSDAHQVQVDQRRSGFADFHKNHMFAPTPNHGFAPLKGRGHMLEAVVAGANDRPKAEKLAAFALWHKTHRFALSGTHAMVPQKFGGTFEKVSSDFTKHIKDAVTRRFLERRMNDLYVSTGNGAWRRLSHGGKSLEHVSAQVAAPDEGGTRGEPRLAAKGGHELAAAQVVHDQARRLHAQRDLREVQRTIAAHEQAVSFLQGHVVRSDSNATATNPGTLPLIAANAVKKPAG